jgi:hypothetical protein
MPPSSAEQISTAFDRLSVGDEDGAIAAAWYERAWITATRRIATRRMLTLILAPAVCERWIAMRVTPPERVPHELLIRHGHVLSKNSIG